MPLQVGSLVHFVTTGGYPDQPGTCLRAEVLSLNPDTHTEELHLKVETSGGESYEKREIRHDVTGKQETWHYANREHPNTRCYPPPPAGPDFLPSAALGGRVRGKDADEGWEREAREAREAREEQQKPRRLISHPDQSLPEAEWGEDKPTQLPSAGADLKADAGMEVEGGKLIRKRKVHEGD